MPGNVDLLFERFKIRRDRPAVRENGRVYSYGELKSSVKNWLDVIRASGIKKGDAVGVRSDYSLASIALFLALLKNKNVAALIPESAPDPMPYVNDARVSAWFEADGTGKFNFLRMPAVSSHALLRDLAAGGNAGVVIFSSGATGRAKAVLHDAERLLSKYESARKPYRTLAFLLFDHMAGLDTLFYSLFSGGSLVLTPGRDVKSICAAVSSAGVEVLPASPTFLRLLCLSGDVDRGDWSSLKIITYGSEPMDSPTLKRVQALFPGVRLIQRYGTSELGSPRSQSKDDGSLWIRMGDEKFQTRVKDGLLWVKSSSAMLGYLNAGNPPQEDGWVCTGDAVEVDGEWMRILGRKSDLIIVGGEKVFPQEVEQAILELDDVVEARVWGEPQPLMGQVVVALIRTARPMDDEEATRLVRLHCRKTLAPHKIPVRIEVQTEGLAGPRYKKSRPVVNIP